MDGPVDYRYVIAGILIFFGVMELAFATFHSREKVTKRDLYIEVIATGLLFILINPAVIFIAPVIWEEFFPGSKNSLGYLSWGAMVLILIVADDMLQYWWHRACHTFRWMYNWHRAHHSGAYMGVRVVYRNNFFYMALIPIQWITAVLIHLGFGPVYAIYVSVKYLVIVGAHSTVKWDQWLLRQPGLAPLVWVLQRTISTPATHFAHHGKHKSDGVTNYKGNYGNLFFFWDVLFGTAKISQTYPQEFGLEDISAKSWQHEMFWPICRDREEDNVVAPSNVPID